LHREGFRAARLLKFPESPINPTIRSITQIAKQEKQKTMEATVIGQQWPARYSVDVNNQKQ